VRGAFAVEIGLAAIGLIRKIAAALNHDCAHGSAFAFLRRNRWRSFPTTHLCALLFENCLAREAYAVAFHRQHLHQNLVAFFQFIADIRYAVLSHFADVQQPVGAGNDLNESTEVGQARDFAQVSLSYLGGRRDIANNLQRLRCGRLIARRDFHQPGIFHVDLDAGLLHDAADHFAAGSDQIANLVHRDLHRVEARRVF
jgi:hypothetical protein